MFGKLSLGAFILTIIFVIMAFNDLFSAYVAMYFPLLGVVLGVIGLKKKNDLSKLGTWTNASIFVLLIFWAYIPPMIFGGA